MKGRSTIRPFGQEQEKIVSLLPSPSGFGFCEGGAEFPDGLKPLASDDIDPDTMSRDGVQGVSRPRGSQHRALRSDALVAELSFDLQLTQGGSQTSGLGFGGSEA
jgi:hypothetical protein